MVDFAGIGPNAGARIGLDPAYAGRLHASNAAPGTVPNALSSAVAAASAGEKMGTDTGPGGHDSAAWARKSRGPASGRSAAQGLASGQERPLREDMLTGPPPTFEASLLELETDLRLALARIQASGYGAAPAAQEAPAGPDRPDGAPGQTGQGAAPEATKSAAPPPAPATAEAAPDGDTPAEEARERPDTAQDADDRR